MEWSLGNIAKCKKQGEDQNIWYGTFSLRKGVTYLIFHTLKTIGQKTIIIKNG